MAKKKETQRLVISPESAEGAGEIGGTVHYLGNAYTVIEQLHDEHGPGLIIERERILIVPDPPQETFEELLNVEMQWESQTVIDMEAWLEEGIQLYHRLLHYYPEEVRFKYALASLLLEAGTNAKLKWLNRSKAETLLLQALQLQSNHPLIHYHLGFIHWYEQRWKEANDHFSSALNTGKLSKKQTIRALGALAVSAARLGQSELADSYVAQAWKTDRVREFVPEIELVRLQVAMYEQKNRTSCAVMENGQVRVVPYEDIDELTLDAVDTGAYVLDMTKRRPLFSGPADALPLQPRLAQLLEFLLKQTKPRTAHEIAEELFTGSRAERVRVYMQHLRQAIAPCLVMTEQDAITTEPEGYIWNPSCRALLVLLQDPREVNKMLV